MTDIKVALLGRAAGEQAAAVIAGEHGMRVVAMAADRASFDAELDEHAPSVALIDAAALGPEDLVEVCRAAARRGLGAIVLGGGSDASLLSRAVMAGARGFLIRPYDPDELVDAIREVSAKTTSDAPADRDAGGATVIAVYGPKGGSGATTIATAVAVTLAARAGSRVGLLDLDLRFGDVGIALDLKSPNSITDLVAQPGSVDQALVDDLFVRHSSGVQVLLAPETLALADAVEPASVGRAVEALRPHFDLLVCDLPSSFDDMTGTVLQLADAVLLVTTPELAALKDLQRAIVAAPPLRSEQRTKLVVNRFPSRAAVDVAEIERALGRKVALTIASDGAAITAALNTGIPVVDPRAHVRGAKSFRDLADLVAGQAGPARAA